MYLVKERVFTLSQCRTGLSFEAWLVPSRIYPVIQIPASEATSNPHWMQQTTGGGFLWLGHCTMAEDLTKSLLRPDIYWCHKVEDLCVVAVAQNSQKAPTQEHCTRIEGTEGGKRKAGKPTRPGHWYPVTPGQE